jgi:hypothetical protein
MKSILITEAEYQGFTDEQRQIYSDFVKAIKYSKRMKPFEFLKSILKEASTSQKYVFFARCKNAGIISKEGTCKESEMKVLYESNKDLRSQDTIISDFEKENKYDVWTYFKKFRNKEITMKKGLAICKKIQKHGIVAFGKKTVYPLEILEKIK